MILTKNTIEAMGYKEYPDNDLIKISFGIIRVYSLQGLVFEKDCEHKKSDAATLLDRCTVAIAQSVNEASRLLTGDVFVDDEEKWLSEQKVNPPFLLIYFKESVLRELKGGYRQEKDGYIYTYDAFPEGKKEIREWEDEALPGIVTYLTVNLSTLDKQVKLVPVARSIFGVTKDGITLFDLKLSGSGSVSVSYPKSIEQINTSLRYSRGLLPVFTKDVCRNFYAALNETDRLKQFIGYFQFIERYTHSTFKTLSYGNDARGVFNVPQRIHQPVSKFFENIFSESKNLAQRFHWCAIISWENIEEDDINSFLEVKKVRDRLSHGEHVEELELPVEKVKILALKILGTKKT